MIAIDLLLKFGAQLKTITKGELIFNEGDEPRYYYQVATGEVVMHNFNDEGKEFIQSISETGESFGVPPLLIGRPHPTNASALTDASVYILPKANFFEMMKTHPETAIEVMMVIAKRLYYKSVIVSEISTQEPEHRLLKLIDYLKFHVEGLTTADKYFVKLTRQQLADLTGLRVETVIRAIKALEKKGALAIEHRKIYR